MDVVLIGGASCHAPVTFGDVAHSGDVEDSLAGAAELKDQRCLIQPGPLAPGPLADLSWVVIGFWPPDRVLIRVKWLAGVRVIMPSKNLALVVGLN
jgi:hypothetical protein